MPIHPASPASIAIGMILTLSACQSAPPATEVTVPILFSDHMVIQRDQAVPVWGKASPGGIVTVMFQDMKAEAVAAADSSWRVTLSPKSAGGPYALSIAGQDTITLNDVLVGDVWIGSGQSNMQWSVEQSDRADEEIAAANYPNIRLFSVDRTVASRPRSSIPSDGWHVTSPATIPGFSAVAYYFGRSLHDSLNIPIGLIHSSWGGTVAEAWTSADALNEMPDFQPAVAELDRLAEQFDQGPDAFQAMYDAWLDGIREHDRGYADGEPVWSQPAFDASDWAEMVVPALWEDEHLPNYDGIVWFRKTFDLPQRWAGQPLSLNLGTIDDTDITWVNGEEVGQTMQYNRARTYTVPADILKPGRNTIAIRVLDTGGGGGIWGDATAMHISPEKSPSDKLALSGPWQFETGVSLEGMDRLPPSPTGRQNTPTVLYNAMIHPLVPYGMRGVIWYQGESNAGRAHQYRTLFPTLINDWRKQWNVNFPFLFVQLANFRERQQHPSEEQTWPELREAQTMALQLPNTGMAVIIDIGEADDIHPTNKQDVGARLARAALNIHYERPITAGGPLYKEMRMDGAAIRLSFDQVGSGLTVRNSEELIGFAVAGEDRQFHWADARIEEAEVVVSSPNVPLPVAVRYGWADNPVGNLYNLDGLPASPFRTDDWPGITQ